jgi:hypothetical protein
MKLFRYVLIIIVGQLFLFGCMPETTPKKRAKAIDFSVTDTTTEEGCSSEQYITFDDNSKYSCTSACSTNYHIATSTELTNFKTTNEDNDAVLKLLNASKGLCIDDASSLRPSGEVYVSSDFCACLNKKSDIINDCDSVCAAKTSTTVPTLYGSVTLGSLVANNSKFGSLYNWCNAQLDSDATTPQCTLSASDGTNSIDNIPVTINKSSNTFSADISSLAYNTTYIVKIVETKAGTNAASTEFQVRRVKQESNSGTVGALKISPISQYTCLTYGGTTDTSGIITRTSYAKVFYYYPANETPAPIPAAGGTNQSTVVCHDEISNGATDNSLYPRLEMIPAQFTLWDKTEPRFVKTNNIMAINSTIQARLLEEYSVSYTVDLFTLISYPNRPSISTSSSTSTASSIAQGYMMVPFINSTTTKAYCPKAEHFNGTDALFKVLKDYTSETEGIYLGEKEAELVQEGTSYKTIYGTMFTTESILTKYGFYVQNGLKVKASSDSLHNKTIYYYWPANDNMDPLQQGDRRLYTVRYYDQLNGNSPSGVTNSVRPSDKRIGCVPTTSE